MARPQPRQRRRAVTWLKYIFLLINGLFISLGVALVVVSAALRTDLMDISPVIETPEHATLAVTLVGVVIFVAVAIGLIGSASKNSAALVAYASFMVLLFVTESMILYVCFFEFYEQMDTRSVHRLDELIADYATENSTSKDIVDNVQRNLKCCGSNDTDIWLDLFEKYPPSCCELSTPLCSEADFTLSCAAKIKDKLSRPCLVLMSTLIVFACLQVIAIGTSLLLAKAFTSKRRRVNSVHEKVRMLR